MALEFWRMGGKEMLEVEDAAKVEGSDPLPPLPITLTL